MLLPSGITVMFDLIKNHNHVTVIKIMMSVRLWLLMFKTLCLLSFDSCCSNECLECIRLAHILHCYMLHGPDRKYEKLMPQNTVEPHEFLFALVLKRNGERKRYQCFSAHMAASLATCLGGFIADYLFHQCSDLYQGSKWVASFKYQWLFQS